MSDSTVLAHVLTLLNDRNDYGLDLFLLSIDEGITGYRDDSLEVPCGLCVTYILGELEPSLTCMALFTLPSEDCQAKQGTVQAPPQGL